MQVVIDIEDSLYEWVHRQLDVDEGWSMVQDAIMSGIVLPRGHGKLIDTSELLTVTDIREDGSEVTYVLYSDIENANTIIEADREV
jgi:hypothetical protein